MQEPEDCQGPVRLDTGNNAPLLANATTYETILFQNETDDHTVVALVTNYVYADDQDCSTRRVSSVSISNVLTPRLIEQGLCMPLALKVRDAEYFAINVTESQIALNPNASLTVTVAIKPDPLMPDEFQPYVLIAKGHLPTRFDDRLVQDSTPVASIPAGNLTAGIYYIAVVGSIRAVGDDQWATETLCKQAVVALESWGKPIPVVLSISQTTSAGSTVCRGAGYCDEESETGQCMCTDATKIGDDCSQDKPSAVDTKSASKFDNLHIALMTVCSVLGFVLLVMVCTFCKKNPRTYVSV